ncbi:MAG TPA: hypothetical protein VND65_08790 [Candidatus Binatia bacterium]|nr:hypothetical protein [Candidatus Binatia bacterium]
MSRTMVKTICMGITSGAVIFVLSLSCLAQDSPSTPKSSAPKPAAGSAAYYAFRDTVDRVPRDDHSPHFKLSADYPTKNPGKCRECPWLKLDVDFDPVFPPGGSPAKDGTVPQSTAPDSKKWREGKWDQYVQSIFDYVRKGQDPNLDDKVGVTTVVSGKTRWFNIPWMAYDPTAGREYLHGTTNERTAHVSELVQGSNRVPGGPGAEAFVVRPGASHSMMPVVANPQFRGTNALAFTEVNCGTQYQNYGFETWAVGYYNEWGGYSIGQAIPHVGKQSGVPQIVEYMGNHMPDGLPFEGGTVVMKVLTTNAPADCVPMLKGSTEWHVNRHKLGKDGYDCEREVQTNRILQLDVAVVDHRSPTRWVYATFAYDGELPGKTLWDRLMPLGVQWGADPWSFPGIPRHDSLPLQQTVINPASNGLVQHYGCEGRLAGPVDNPQSSCLSCHGSAYAVERAPSVMGLNVPPSFGFDGMCVQYSLDNAAYFQNQVPPQHFPDGRFPDAMSMDTSLQLEVAFDQYGNYYANHKPVKCTDPNQITPGGN